MRSKLVVTLIVFCCMGSISSVEGKTKPNNSEPFVKLTPEQIALNEKAIEAQKVGDYAKAQHFIESMILIQETDISWMQLGRLYEFQGKCLMSQEAYNHVSTAPPTKDVPHAVVLDQLIKYQKTHRDTCSATLVLECKSPGMTVTIDDDKSMPCSSEPFMVTPGNHTIKAKTNYGESTLNIYLLSGKTLITAVEVVNYEMLAYQSGAIYDDETLQRINQTSQKYKIAGWSLLGGGLAMATAGGVLYGLTYKEMQDKRKTDGADSDAYRQYYNDNKSRTTTGAILLGIGSGAALTGCVLLIVDAFKNRNRSEALTDRSWRLTPYTAPNATGINLTCLF